MTIASRPFTHSGISIDVIPSRECLRRFSCGVREIDKWAREKAFKLHQRNRSRVFCAGLAGNANSAGFYALSFSPVNSNLLFGSDREAYADGHAPFIYIDWLAVQSQMQNQKIGTILLMNALQRAYTVSYHLPVYGVALRSLNDRTRQKYESHGFVVREESAHPLMILPMLTLIDLFSGANS